MKSLVSLFALLITLMLPVNADELSARVYAAQWVSKNSKQTSDADVTKIVNAVFENGAKHRIEPLLLLSLIKKESTFNKKARNKSNASGLMQVIPYWHRDKIKGRNIFSVQVNVEVGTIILRNCLDKYHGNMNYALKCYSGGSGQSYIRQVYKDRRIIQQWIIEQQFMYQLPLYQAQAPNYQGIL